MHRSRVVLSLFTILLGACLTGCATSDTAAESRPDGGQHFSSPADAVERITELLEAKDWPTLARYYDLEGSGVNPARLVSGEFFYTEQPPASAHPAGFWRYKHPFAPGFKYLRDDPVAEETDTIVVTVMVEIDQGGGMIQRGLETFMMKKSRSGWQILPGRADGPG